MDVIIYPCPNLDADYIPKMLKKNPQNSAFQLQTIHCYEISANGIYPCLYCYAFISCLGDLIDMTHLGIMDPQCQGMLIFSIPSKSFEIVSLFRLYRDLGKVVVFRVEFWEILCNRIHTSPNARTHVMLIMFCTLWPLTIKHHNTFDDDLWSITETLLSHFLGNTIS